MGSLFSPIRSRREASFLPCFPSLAHMDGPHARLKSNRSKVLLLEPPFCVAGETTWEKMCNQVLWFSSSLHLPALTLHPQPTHLPSPILLILVLAAFYASTKIQKAPQSSKFWAQLHHQPSRHFPWLVLPEPLCSYCQMA